MDQHIEGVFKTLGEQPPDDIFVRYEWRDYANDDDADVTTNYARPGGPGTIVDTAILMDEHELVHAVQQQAWPSAPAFLREGMAVMFDETVPDPWPEGADIEVMFAATDAQSLSYHQAWFLTSQIVAEHGFEGLRDFWFSVRPDDEPSEIRAAYQELFQESIVALIGPLDSGQERWPCAWTVCGEAIEWDRTDADLPIPGDCEEGSLTFGPTSPTGTGNFVRRYAVEFEDSHSYRITANGQIAVAYKPCGLNCDRRGSSESGAGPGETSDLRIITHTTYRFDVFTIGTDPADASVEIVRQEP